MSGENERLPLTVLWEAPLALASFLYYRISRAQIRAVWRLRARVEKGDRWQLLSGETIRKPGALLVLMTSGPRWNTHAIVGSMGPLTVEKSLAFTLEEPRRSAGTWIIAVYAFPELRIVATIASRSAPGGDVAEIELPPGQYNVVARYYEGSDDIALPAVRVDGVEKVPAQPVPPDTNAFYEELRDRRGPVFLGFHYYVYVLLKYRKWLSDAFVAREYAPIGSTETGFSYGAMPAGQRLRVRTDPALLAGHDVYVTLYNRWSFPVSWERITEAEYLSAPTSQACTYLIRLNARNAGTAPFQPEQIQADAVPGQ